MGCAEGISGEEEEEEDERVVAEVVAEEAWATNSACSRVCAYVS